MFKYYTYDEYSKKLNTYLVKEDDRDFQLGCNEHSHEFAPNSIECACGKYSNINYLVQKNASI